MALAGQIRSRQRGWLDMDLLAKPFSEILHSDDRAVPGKVVAALMSGKVVHPFRVRSLGADGTPISSRGLP